MKPEPYAAEENRRSEFLGLVRGAVGSLALRGVSTAAGVITSIILARLLGADGYGVYAYALAVVGLLSVPAALGLPPLFVRNIAAYQTQSAWGLVRGLLRRGNQAVLVVSLGLVILTAVIGWALAGYFEWYTLLTFWVSLMILPVVGPMYLKQAALQGFGHVVSGQVPDLLIRPLLFICLVVVAYVFVGDGFGSIWAVGMQVIAVAAALLVGAGLLKTRIPKAVRDTTPEYQSWVWSTGALPLLLISALHVVNNQTDILILGVMKGPEAVGIYGVAARGAELIQFTVMAVNVVLQPAVASLYASKDMERLQRVVTTSARAVLLSSLPVAMILIFFGPWLLLIFGREFTGGATALSILSVGHVANAGMGSVALLLNMTGHERDTALVVSLSAVTNVVLNAMLIPRWGIEGAAAATAIGLVIWKLLLVLVAYKRMRIHTTVLGRFPRRGLTSTRNGVKRGDG